MTLRRHRAPVLAILITVTLLFTSLVPVQAAKNPSPTDLALANQLPVITVWYESALNFGRMGNPQNQVNILGNVSDPDGSVVSLTYKLNTDPTVNTLSIGTGTSAGNVRLMNLGDFNISLNTSALNNGANSVVITAKDNNGGVQSKTVTFNYTASRTWPLPYSTNWSTASNISDQAQVVDGLWNLSASGVEPVYFGYDRLIAIGDLNWSQYEILVPVTVHAFYPNPDPNYPDDKGGVGVISRWSGHFTDPSHPNEQPPTGWWNIGAYAYYSNRLGALALRLGQAESTVSTQSYPFALNKTYMFKLRSETIAGVGRYSFKIWEAGTPEPDWADPQFTSIINKTDVPGDPQQGSMLLVAHRADATFGDVTVCPLTGVNYSLNISTNGNGQVLSQPSQTGYPCGQGVTVTAQAAPNWTFTGWSGGVQSANPTISFNMIKNYNLTANFALAGQTQVGRLYIPIVNR